MPDFSVSVSEWVAKMRRRADLAVQVIAMDAVNRVKELTPVDTGFLRSNWTVIKKRDAEPVAGAVPDPAKTIRAVKAGDTVTIINPTIYARRIEYGFVGEDKLGRQYHQQGAHMMAQTIAELPQIARAAVTRLR